MDQEGFCPRCQERAKQISTVYDDYIKIIEKRLNESLKKSTQLTYVVSADTLRKFYDYIEEEAGYLGLNKYGNVVKNFFEKQFLPNSEK